MHELTCCLISGMGCRSTKHHNSVADDVTTNNDAYVDSTTCHVILDADSNGNKKGGRNKKTPGTNGIMEVNEKNIPNNKRIPNLHPARADRPYTQSQQDFFEMLDKKISDGKDYISEDEAR